MDHTHVSYGDLGRASYDVNSKTWGFQRDPASGIQLKLLEYDLVFPGLQRPSGTVDSSLLSDPLIPARARAKRINALLRTYPEIIPGCPVLPGFEQISAAATELQDVYEPLAGDTIAHGTVGYEEPGSIPERVTSKGVLASVTGTSRHIVRLSLIHEEIRSARQGIEKVEFVTGGYHSNHTVFWGGEHKTCILQVLFSADNGNGSFLAARRHAEVDILKPIVRRASKSKSKLRKVDIGTGEAVAASQLDPNWILRISIENLVIADFTFNSWNQTECALLSTSGEIKVLDIQTPQRDRRSWTITAKAEVAVEESNTGAVPNDGWGKIVWLNSQGQILVARRTRVSPYTLSDDGLSASLLNLNFPPVNCQVLDARYDSLSKYSFILTSTTLAVLIARSTSDGSSVDEDLVGEEHNGLDLVISCLHHRDHEDFSLYLTIASSDRGIIVLISSRITSLVTGFKIYLDCESGDFKHISESFMLDIQKDLQSKHLTQQLEYRTEGLHISSLSICVAEFASTDCPTPLEILLLSRSCEVVRMIYVAKNRDAPSSDIVLFPLSGGGTGNFAESSQRRKQCSFLVDSEESSEGEEPISVSMSRAQPSNVSAPTSNFTFVATNINNRLRSAFGEVPSMGYFDSALKTIIEDHSNLDAGVHILADFLSSSLPLDTIDIQSTKTSELLSTIREAAEQPYDSTLEALDAPKRIDLSDLLTPQMIDEIRANKDEEVNLRQIYEKSLQLYLHSLPAETSPQLKTWLESVIRQVSMFLFLSIHGIQVSDQSESFPTEVGEEVDPFGLGSLTLPVRIRDNEEEGSLSTHRSQETKRSTSRSRPPSSASGHPSTSQQLSDNDSEALKAPGTVLAKYVNVRLPSPLPRAMRNRVSKWQMGEEWKTMSRSASQDSLMSARREKKGKGDKGKGRAVELAHLDSDNELFSSQAVSSQQLPIASQNRRLNQDSPQQAPLSSALNQNLSSQSKKVPKKKRPNIKKRPAGFR